MIRPLIFSLIMFTSLNCFSKETLYKVCSFTQKEDTKNDKRLTNFALDPIIRANSEKMLSILISAKSPMITSWVKARNIDPVNSPELVALEWNKYYAKNFIITRYPNSDAAIDQKIEELFEAYLKNSFDEKIKKKYESFFSEAKIESKKAIENFPISKEEKKILLNKIEAVKLYWPRDLKNSKYARAPLEFIDWSLSYDPAHNEINIGINSLDYNDQSLKSNLRHEIAHSFDSCRWSQSHKTPWPFEKIGICLRAMAKTRDDSKLVLFRDSGKMLEADFQKLKNNPTCNNSIYPPIGLQSDQLPETFADWFSAEATPVDSIDQSFRSDLCVEEKLNEGSSYLSNKDRFRKIYLANKKIQKKFNERTDTESCSF